MLPSACAPPLGSATDLRDAALATAGAEDKLQSDYVTFNGGTPLNVSLSTGPPRDADWRYRVAARQPLEILGCSKAAANWRQFANCAVLCMGLPWHHAAAVPRPPIQAGRAQQQPLLAGSLLQCLSPAACAVP